MGIRIARQVAAGIAVAITCLNLLCGGTRAAEEIKPPALSQSCTAPAAEIAMPEPLPHLASALEQKKQIRILAIGYSSMTGFGGSALSRGYPAQLAEILRKAMKGVDVEIINRGVSGEVATSAAERMKVLVAMEKPDLVLWQVGTNDALSRVPIDDFEETVRDMVRWLKEHDVDVVLVGMQYLKRLGKDIDYEAVRQAVSRVAQSEHVLHIRRYNAMEFISRTDEKLQQGGDDLRLDELGYRCMAEHIANAVIANLYLRVAKPPLKR